MLKLIGILTGAAIAIAVLIVALGLPVFAPAAEESVPAAVELPQPAAMSEPEVPEEPISEWLPEPAPLPEPASEAAVLDVQTDTEALVDDIFAAREPVEDNWYSFWSPFRSEIAANGFVAKLQEKTGIDYRVVKIKTGVYEVAFAYTDDSDIASKLDRITMATGLDVSGS